MKNNTNPLTESYPAQRVSDDLRMRVKHLAAQHDDKADQRAQTQRKHRLVLSYGAAATVIGVGALLQPKFAAAAVFAQIERALDGVRSVHEVTWEQGRNTEHWWKVGDVSRTEYSGSTVVVRDGKRYQWLRASNKVIVQPERPPSGMQARSGFTMAALMRDLKLSGWRGSLETLKDTTENGKTFKRFQVTMKSWEGVMRVLLVVDPATQLPKRYEGFVQRESGWEPFNRVELEYNQPETPALFSAEFPGACVLDLEKEKALWGTKIEQAVASAGQLKVHDIRTNPQGAIFVLYTDGRTYEHTVWNPEGPPYGSTELPERWKIEVAGGRYKSLPLYTSHPVTKEKSRTSLANPILRNGQVLQGQWFLPLDPKPISPPKITLRFQEQSPRAFQAALPLTPTMQQDFLPDYWLSLVARRSPYNYADADQVLRQRFESARATELMRHRASLPQALEALEAEEALGAPDHNFFLKKTQVLGLLGRRVEAEKTLQRALTVHADQSRRFPKQYESDYFFWEQVCTSWYAIGDEAKAIEMREKAMKLEQRNFPGRVTWYREHPEDLKPKLD